MNVESGIYDGDMILGKNYLQPDKAGSFGFELVHLYKKTGEQKYLDAAIRMANTLAHMVEPGDSSHSPWPFKVNAVTGETGILLDKAEWHEGMDKELDTSMQNKKFTSYTTNWTGTLGLFSELIKLNKGNKEQYLRAFDITIAWLRTWPAKNNRWGPFFEDVPRWSDTQINGITYAMFIMENPQLDPNWKQTVKNIFQWVYERLGEDAFAKYGVTVVAEQTAYKVAGNSHSSRQASMELMYWEKTGDSAYVLNAIRQLHWATYMVDHDGKNFYPTNDIWMTDGYGDYTRHYIRAMASCPQLAPENKDHMLRSSSIVQKINYQPGQIIYITFDESSEEKFRLISIPKKIMVNGKELPKKINDAAVGWTWLQLDKGGTLIISKNFKGPVIIEK